MNMHTPGFVAAAEESFLQATQESDQKGLQDLLDTFNKEKNNPSADVPATPTNLVWRDEFGRIQIQNWQNIKKPRGPEPS